MSEHDTVAPQDISKKELLEETGISYGQLYRWKREGLIPEEWFEKRSAFTGQETFFPRKPVLERVEAIRSMKDGLSLSEIREMLNAEPKLANLKQVLLATGNISEDFINELAVDADGLWLSEFSAKAVATLYSALGKTEAGKQATIDLVSQVIKALAVEAPAPPDNAEPDASEAEAQQPEQAEFVEAEILEEEG